MAACDIDAAACQHRERVVAGDIAIAFDEQIERAPDLRIRLN